jgi:3'(2'), 5'-bisphosphate nucleotidase
MATPYEAELAAALEAARLAADFCRREYASFVPIPNAPVTISTHVDHGAQEIILTHLRAAFPAYGVVAEEKTPAAENPPTGDAHCWVVDPIDGSRGFAMKNGEFSVMIGLTRGDRVVLGVVSEPVADRVTFAIDGQGCFVQRGDLAPERCRVTATAELSDSVLTQSHSKPGAPPKGVVVTLTPGRVHETYSAGVKLALVARGEADLYVNDYLNFHDWDICAGDILVTEAGGAVSLFSGDRVTYGGRGAKQRRGMVATNGVLQAEVVRRLSVAG